MTPHPAAGSLFRFNRRNAPAVFNRVVMPVDREVL
jgi:hypothetical protein